MAEIKAPRGVRDILPDESWKWTYVLNQAHAVAEDFGYAEVHLPIFEHTELFSRGIGETTDVVEKEMYTFTDRGERSLTLRPEATASMVRSYVEHDMGKGMQPVKLWCAGPMFRYERPQKGRYRQFWQIDFEALGSSNPMVDVEIIELSLELFRRLGLTNLEVMVNSVGCPKCRPVYKERLMAYFAPHLGTLCESCVSRYSRNPLRILDCKREECRAVTENAPGIHDSLCDDCRTHFEAVTSGLTRLGAVYHIDKRLVRGLDYYTKTAYEVLSGQLGAQNAVCGGGRYDNLSEAIGGPALPSVGFATGLDRIILVMEEQGCSFGRRPRPVVYVIAQTPASRDGAQLFATTLRRAGVAAEMDYTDRTMKSQFKVASSIAARFAAILGESEMENGTVSLKNLESGEQVEIPQDLVAGKIRELCASD
jgi:histidyl-tRNA synthetase